MPLSVPAQVQVRTHAAQWFAESRPPQAASTSKRARAEEVKHEGEEGKRTETKAAIVKYQETKLEAPKRA